MPRPDHEGNPMIRKTISLLALSLLILASTAFRSPNLQAATQHLAAAEYYAAPYGSPSGNGSYSSPWDLATALAQPPVLQPGDMIWLLGGRYAGPFTSDLTGSAAAPIVVRALPSARALLDGGTAYASTLQVNGSYCNSHEFAKFSNNINFVVLQYIYRPIAS
jgi:hypothetical protein